MVSGKQFINRIYLIALFIAMAVGATQGANHMLLSLEFDSSSFIGYQANGLPAATQIGDIAIASKGIADFGSSGRLSVSSFVSPTGPFTIESRYLLKGYAPSSSNYLSDIVTTASWDVGSQGFALRVGGGHMYPLLPRESYVDGNAYIQTGSWDMMIRASISRAISCFTMGAHPSATIWREAYGDRCIDVNRWVYMVSTYDGTSMRIFINGIEATDVWRLVNQNQTPNLYSATTLTVGARNSGSYDSRHFNGLMDFVRIVDTAMSAAQIRRNYRATFAENQQSSLCFDIALPDYPQTAQQVGSDRKFRFKLVTNGACGDSLLQKLLQLGDSLQIQFARDPEFSTIQCQKSIGDTLFELADSIISNYGLAFGECYWRARIKYKAEGMAKSLAADSTEWGFSKPFMLSASPTRIGAFNEKYTQQKNFVFMQGNIVKLGGFASVPSVYSLKGTRLSRSISADKGAFYLDLAGCNPGVYIVRTKEKSMRVVVQ